MAKAERGNGSKYGEYRGIYRVLHRSPEFRALGENGRHILYVLKIELGQSGIDVVNAYVDVLRDLTGKSKMRVERGLAELAEGDWIVIDEAAQIIWIRNGLKFEPSMSMSNPNHRKAILKHLRNLPQRPIVREFARYYSLPDPFGIVKELGDRGPQEQLPLSDEEQRT